MAQFEGELRAVIGLGNPGPAYENTRHNMGYIVVRSLIKQYPCMRKRVIPGVLRVAWLNVDDHEVGAVLPLTFMNRSGLAMHELIHRYHLRPSELLVVCDDFELPLGTLRLRTQGGASSHRGLGDILNILGTEELPRLRLGIGVEPEPDNKAEFVLQPFQEQEWPQVQAMINRAIDIILSILSQGYQKTMSFSNAIP